MNPIFRSSALAAITLAALTGCSTASSPAASPTTTTPPSTVTSTGFPEPPPYQAEVDGNQVRVTVTTADPTDLLNTYNAVARAFRPTLPEGAYWVRINCATTEQGGQPTRLANGTLGIGKKGIAVHGDFGSFTGVVPNATCAVP